MLACRYFQLLISGRYCSLRIEGSINPSSPKFISTKIVDEATYQTSIATQDFQIMDTHGEYANPWNSPDVDMPSPSTRTTAIVATGAVIFTMTDLDPRTAKGWRYASDQDFLDNIPGWTERRPLSSDFRTTALSLRETSPHSATRTSTFYIFCQVEEGEHINILFVVSGST